MEPAAAFGIIAIISIVSIGIMIYVLREVSKWGK